MVDLDEAELGEEWEREDARLKLEAIRERLARGVEIAAGPKVDELCPSFTFCGL